MKFKNFIWIMAIGFGLTFGLTACSDDDDDIVDSSSSTDTSDDDDTDAEETTTGYAAAVAGTYSGYVDVMFSYITNPYAYPEETLTITAADDTTVDVAYENELWGTYAISGATVSDNGDGTYSIEGTGTATMAGHSSTSEYDATFTATVSEEGESEFAFEMAVMGTTYVNFHEGDAPASYYAYGDYEGYTEVLFSYITTPMGYGNETVSVAINADDYSLVDISYENDTWGTYTVTGATATDNGDGTYSIEGTGTATISYHGSSASEYDCTVTATISEGSSTVEFSMTFMGGTTVSFYEGDSPAAYIAQGDYEGALALSVSGMDVGTVSETVTIEATGQEEASITLTGFDITVAAMSMSISLGDMEITGVAVSTDDNETCTLSASGVSFTVDYNGSEIEATADVSGSVINGDEQSGEVTFTFTLGSMPLPITATFTVGATVEDDTETGTPGGASAIAGSYTGTLGLAYSGYTVSTVSDQSLTISADEDDTTDATATVVLDAFNIDVEMLGGSFAVSAITIEGVSVSTLSDGTYSVSASDISVPVTFDENDTTVTGSLSGTISSDKSSLDLTFELDFGGMAFTATFTI